MLATDNLCAGLKVVADAVNPLAITRDAWRQVAQHAGVPAIEIEVICSAAPEHSRRIESRMTDVCELNLPTWQEALVRECDPWDQARILIDRAGHTVERSFTGLQRALAEQLRALKPDTNH